MTAHYFAATSTASLAAVCGHLQRAFATEPFEFDSQAHWEYGWASSDGLSFNITRCSDNETIENWIEDTPRGVKYQAIVWCPGSEDDGVLVRLEEELGAALGGRVEHFSSSAESSPTGAVGELGSLDEEPSSGFSLPFMWFIAVGLLAVGVFVVRACSV